MSGLEALSRGKTPLGDQGVVSSDVQAGVMVEWQRIGAITAVIDNYAAIGRSLIVERLVQSVQHEAGAGGARHPSAHDPAGEGGQHTRGQQHSATKQQACLAESIARTWISGWERGCV